jgi:outer membrane immunogenic protein
MHNYKLAFVLAAAMGFGGAQVASAADMPVKARPMAPVPVAYNWTGCYVGGNVGGLWARKDWNLDPTGTPIGSNDPSGFLGGGQIGCNYQVSTFVFGIQGDYDWTDASASNNDLIQTSYTDRTRIKGLASVTGRAGYAWDRFLAYAKGGAAWVRDDYDVHLTATGAPGAAASETRTGWTAGVGGEYAFAPSWSAFVEYDYYDFGTRSNTFLTPAGGVWEIADIRERMSVLKGGINFRFFGAQ